eukprot:tig00001629_g9520.t1
MDRPCTRVAGRRHADPQWLCKAKQPTTPKRERTIEEVEKAVKEPIPSWAKNATLAVPSVLLGGALLISAAGEQGSAFLQDSHVRMLALNLAFATGHSGLAALRPRGEAWMGARAYRVLFALFSLPMAGALITYFLVHRYDGVQLWQLQGIPGMREFVCFLSALSFIFLYPATFNLAEVAAINKPQVRLYEEGIIRITRHPQMVGQGIWCLAHSLWIGSSFTLVTSFGLMAHHIFAVWHGDKRLRERFGEAFEEVAARTSVLPFQAILEGRNRLVLKEFLRPAYVGTTAFVLLFYKLHPVMFNAVKDLHF